jgi:predicted RNA methylase
VICRAGSAAIAPALAALATAATRARPGLLSLLGRLAAATHDARLYPVLLGALADPEPLARRRAARALGKLGDSRAEEPLLLALSSASSLEQKSLVDALAGVGGGAALDALAALAPGDPDLERRRQRALSLIERRSNRGDPSVLRLDQPLGSPCRVVLSCRAGLSSIVAEQLAALSPRVIGPSHVELEHQGTLGALLTARSAMDFGLVIPIDESAAAEPIERIAEALTRPDTLRRLEGVTKGPLRFRIAWSDGAHHRAPTWALARAVRARTRALENDSRMALWTARADVGGRGQIELVPRLDPDPRFAYRARTVAAASHPTLAAALAHVAGVRADEIAWDPFVGSGAELAERARLGSVRELWGSDTDSQALDAARLNLGALEGAPTPQLVRANALEFAPAGVTLILTNPPMGRRVARDGSIATLLEGFVKHAARVLVPSGRMVWLSPLAAKTERAARSAGLRVIAGPDVDMGGFSARLQVFVRPA